jgi:hypothetical protein
VCTVFTASEQGPVMGSCEHGNQSTDSVECIGFLYQLADCKLFKKDFVSWSKSFDYGPSLE